MTKKKSTDSHHYSVLETEREHAREVFHNATLSLEKSSKIFARQEEQLDWDTENERLDLENRKEKREVRKRWNHVLMWLVLAGFILSYFMIALIGLGIMQFENNAFAVPSVVAAGVIQTYGLAKLAIKYFFSEDGAKADKNLLSPREEQK